MLLNLHKAVGLHLQFHMKSETCCAELPCLLETPKGNQLHGSRSHKDKFCAVHPTLPSNQKDSQGQCYRMLGFTVVSHSRITSFSGKNSIWFHSQWQLWHLIILNGTKSKLSPHLCFCCLFDGSWLATNVTAAAPRTTFLDNISNTLQLWDIVMSNIKVILYTCPIWNHHPCKYHLYPSLHSRPCTVTIPLFLQPAALTSSFLFYCFPWTN